MAAHSETLPSGVLPGGTLDANIRGARGGRAPRTREILLGQAGRCPETPTHTIKLFDNSGSVFSLGGNDSVGRRFEEARIAVERVGRRCRCHQELVSILHFDTPTSGDVAAAPLDRVGRSAIERGLAVPPDGAGTSTLGPSLRRAYALAQQNPEHLSILVALTDFQLFDSSLDRVLDDFCSFPGLVHAVVLRAAPPTRLVDDDRVIVTRVDYDTPPGGVARAVFDALTTYRPNRKLHREGGTGS